MVDRLGRGGEGHGFFQIFCEKKFDRFTAVGGERAGGVRTGRGGGGEWLLVTAFAHIADSLALACQRGREGGEREGGGREGRKAPWMDRTQESPTYHNQSWSAIGTQTSRF